jgi:hypothetical protein
MSEKVVRSEVIECEAFNGGGPNVTFKAIVDPSHEDLEAFDVGESVVVIPASQYERLIALPQKIATAMKTCEDMNDFVWQVTALVKEG